MQGYTIFKVNNYIYPTVNFIRWKGKLKRPDMVPFLEFYFETPCPGLLERKFDILKEW
jgi:hypothetical protein